MEKQVEKDFCKKCNDEKFNDKGISLTPGILHFTCLGCHQPVANFVGGQTVLCHDCSRKMSQCAMCGKLLK